MTTEVLAVRERDPMDLAPQMVVSLDVLRQQLRQLEEFKREIMVIDVDYGVIPGTPKPTLLKPGAEKLALVFGLAPTFVTTSKVENWETGLFHYEVECRLTSKRSGEVVAGASGSANSMEPRYRWRKAERVCPICGKAAIIRGREEFGGGWLCFRKKDGCGAKFQLGDPEIESQEAGNVANSEPYELVNTLLKMAQKRALVAAVLIGTGGSGQFTQDVEDMPSVSGEAYVPTRDREVNDRPRVIEHAPANGNGAAKPQPAPRTVRQAVAQQQIKPTDTKCSVCDRMVESTPLLNDSMKRFSAPFCVGHFNEALEQLKTPADKTEEEPM